MKQTVKSIVVGLILGTLILILISGLITYFYEDEVSLYLVEELNDHISAKIEVDKVKFSVLKKFPKASVELENLVAYSPEGYFKKIQNFNTDTLFAAQSIFVQFNLADLLNNKYHITDIHFNRGDIRLFVDHLGDANYIFWEQKTDQEKSEFTVDLKGVKVTNANVIYCNNATKTTLISTVDRIDFEGNFSKDHYLMEIRSDLLVHQLEVEKIKYLQDQKVKTNLTLNIYDQINQIENGLLTIENLAFDVAGTIENNNSKKIDLNIAGSELPLKSVMKNLPPSLLNEFPLIQGQKGNVSIAMKIKGDDIKIRRPHIEADFHVKNAQIFDEKRKLGIHDILIKGKYSNGKDNDPASTQIVFEKFSAALKNSTIDGQFFLENLHDPTLDIAFFTTMNLSELHKYFETDTIALLEGFAEANVKYRGKYNSLQNVQFADLFTTNYSVDLNLSQGAFQLKDNPVKLEEVSGTIQLNKNLKTENLFFKIQDNDFLINGYISQLFEYFEHQKVFNVNANVDAGHIDLNQLSLLFKEDKKDKKDAVYRLPEKLALTLKLNIKNFEVGKFSATNVRGNLNYKPRMFSLHEISFYSMDGFVKAGGVITQKFDNNFLVRTQSRLDQININKLFYSFNNFGQDFISDKNLNGDLSGEVFFTSEWTDRLEIIKNAIHAENNINIANGEIIGFEPLLGLSKFIDVQELEHIKFSTLTNQITIKDGKLYIPQMDIESSAINIAASGIHGFDNNFSYHIKMLLSDVIAGRLKKSVKRRSEFENIEDDGLGRTALFLLIEGNPDDYKVKYDRKAAREELKNNLQKERSVLKNIFREEFGWGKNDTLIERENQQKEIFEIEWDENKNQKKEVKETIDLEEQKFTIEWEEDTIH